MSDNAPKGAAAGALKLLPCTCGREPTLQTVRVWTAPDGTATRAMVECSKCGLLSYHILKTKKAAINRAVKGWNEWVRRHGGVQVAQRAAAASGVSPESDDGTGPLPIYSGKEIEE
ncbi:MAG: hypothetical protein AB7F35_29760 [Acetobacteraceae bacterium]